MNDDFEYFHARLIYIAATGKLYWRRWDAAPKNWNAKYAGREAGTVDMRVACGRVYPQIRIGLDGKLYVASRIAWLMYYGEWPSQLIDHIDGDRMNNRIRNLRDVSHTVNMNNRYYHRK
jgi:HNH endonuclease